MGNIKVFRVTGSKPTPFENGVGTSSSIEIKFNTDANVKTLDNGIMVVSRKDNSIVKGSVSYENRTMSFTPAIPFEQGMQYDVYVKGSIKNILDMLCSPFSFSFTTKVGIEYKAPILMKPSNMSILELTPRFEWNKVTDTENNDAEAYEIEVSLSEYFNTIFWSTSSYNTDIQSDKEFEGGVLYFWRVRGLSHRDPNSISYGPWSEVFRFIIAKAVQKGIVIEDGEYIDPAYDDLPQIRNDILDRFPNVNFSNVGTNLKTIYIEINGILDLTKVNPRNFSIIGTHITNDINVDDYDPLLEQVEVNHGMLDGRFFIVLDEDNNKTFILFQPYKLE